MGRKKEVKLEDIAQELGVSIVSVSNAIKGRKGVREELRREILQKAQEMGYEAPRPNVGKGKSSRIGVVMTEHNMKEYPSFYMDVYQQTVQEAIRQNYLTVLEIVDPGKENLEMGFDLFKDLDIEGIFVIGEISRAFVRLIKEASKVPVVCIGTYCLEADMDYIVTDDFHGGQHITQRLIDAGHKDIMFVGTSAASTVISDRYMGYCKALMANGLEELRGIFAENGSTGLEIPVVLPDAFVCGSGESAYVLLDKLAERDVKIPEDVSVAGCDCACLKVTRRLLLENFEGDKNALAKIGVNTLKERISGVGKPEGIRVVSGNIEAGNTVAVRRG